MNIYFDNPATGEKIDSPNKPTCEEALGLLRRLTAPSSTLIMQLPSGIGLDFNALDDGLFEVEFYSDDPSNASNALVTMKTAEQIIKRAFEGKQGRTKDIYADLISEWNF
jgi:hypothetical protein